MSAKRRVEDVHVPVSGLRELEWDGDPWSAIRYVASYESNPEPLSSSHVRWFRNLHSTLWEKTSQDRFGRSATVERDNEHVDPEDVLKIFRLTREHRLVTTLGCATFGFTGFTLSFYTFQDEPYPGVGCDCEFLMSMSDDHLPWYRTRDKMGYPVYENTEKKLQLAWELFSAFSHSPENLRMLKGLAHKGLRPPMGRGHYVY